MFCNKVRMLQDPNPGMKIAKEAKEQQTCGIGRNNYESKSVPHFSCCFRSPFRLLPETLNDPWRETEVSALLWFPMEKSTRFAERPKLAHYQHERPAQHLLGPMN